MGAKAREHLEHPKVAKAVKKRLRDQYRTLDPVALLTEIRAAQQDLGNRVDRRAGKTTVPFAPSASDATVFVKVLGKAVEVGEPRGTHQRRKGRYKKRIRMPSKLDPHLATIENWLAVEPQLTAIAIVGRLAERDPDRFGPKQHSIVQRLLRALRKSTAQRLVAAAAEGARIGDQLPGSVDGSGCEGPNPPTDPLSVPALTVDRSANITSSPAG